MTPARPSGGLTAHLVTTDTARAIEFYGRAFGARELFRLVEPSGKVGHAEIAIGDSVLMLADEYPDFGARSAAYFGGSPVRFHLYVNDADAAVQRAIAAGATELRPVADQFYGDRSGMVLDPFGIAWTLATPVEDLSSDEMQRRFSAALGG